MLYFASDYAEGAHEEILRRLAEINREPLPGYGADRYCESAREKIRAACGRPQADVHFLAGGTQTNQIVISALLARHEAVIAADTGHISLHEAGAIEYTGHKVLALPQREGKITADAVERYARDFYADANHEHMAHPGMVYISWPSEYGTLYSRAELEALAGVCRARRLPLFIDGARLAYGLACPASDLTLADIAGLADVFYIGGTKCGALCGEAVVFPKGDAPRHFVTLVKQQGALLAKGRLLGLQFDTLFTDGLYHRLGRHAIDMADRMRAIFREKGCRFFVESPTNQIFLVLDNAEMERLARQVAFSFWEKADETRSVVRFATSWATRAEDVERLAVIL